MGHFVFELQFDKISENKLKKLMNKINDIVPDSDFVKQNIPPHISLISAINVDLTESKDIIRNISTSFSKFSLELNELSSFGSGSGVIFLRPTRDEYLRNLHYKIYESTKPYVVNSDKLYFPDSWIPHVTLANKATKIQIENTLSHKLFNTKVGILIDSIALVEYFPVKTLMKYELNN